MPVNLASGVRQKQAQSAALTPQQRQGLKYLVLSLPELRQELLREMSENPVIDSIEPTLEKTTVSEREDELAAREREPDYPDDGYGREEAYADAIAHAETGGDPEALARREKFFENQAGTETLEEHLLAQVPLSDLDERDYPLAGMLIGELDENGYFVGSLPDLVMVSGESEEKILEVLARIRTFDPVGCASRTHQECLLAQLGAIAEPRVRKTVARLVRDHWEDMAAGRLAAILGDLGIGKTEYADALRALRTLDPRPGRAYAAGRRGTEYVNPEVHAVRCADGYFANVDARSLPEIRISPKYLAMLDDPNAAPEAREYIREKIAAVKSIREAVERRQETISKVAQAIFDAQPDFFRLGLKGLRPLTMQDVAKTTGIHPTTVSRTVHGKYAETPKGTVELRRFFTQGLVTDAGEAVTKDAVLERLLALVESEDKAKPLSDERLSELLKAEGYPVARRTVAKYRTRLKIPGARERSSVS